MSGEHVLSRLRGLIMLETSSNASEGENAARMVCQILRKYPVILSLGGSSISTQPGGGASSVPAPTYVPPGSPGWERTPWGQFTIGQVRMAVIREKTIQKEELEALRKRLLYEQKQNKEHQKKESAETPFRKYSESKYPFTCMECEGEYGVGDTVFWRRVKTGSQTMCETCFLFLKEEKVVR